ncbi:MAG: ATP-binding protein [Hylemonella sp.]|nr:ATP-binding protein [Hylemonella sp.]MDH5707885.1 ATP-binding protein [Hylemonella sp.]
MSKESPEKSLTELVQELRSYQAELEAQNEALRYSRIAAEGASERFESLFSNVPLALMVVDALGMIVQSNAMALELFRPAETDPPLNFLLPLIESAHVQRVEQAFEQARQHGSSEITEVVFLRGSQGTLSGALHMARIEYSQDEMVHFICAVIDQGPLLAERQALQQSAEALRQRNEELRLSENRMAAIINSSLDAIVCIDPQQRITVFNPAAAALFGCPDLMALGTPLTRFLPGAMAAISAVEVGSHAMLGEVEGRSVDGKTLPLEISVSCERHPLGNLTTVFARDLTASKAMEARLRESNKMQAIGTMAGGIAHDFNNILGAILGNASLARQDAPADSPLHVSLTEIEKAGRRARELVRQILTFSRNESTERLPLQLADVVHETMRLFRVTLPPAIVLQHRIDERAPSVLADATQIEQALLNLCTNASQAIGAQRGTIEVDLSSTQLEPTQAAALGVPAGLYARLSVHDSGSGIAQDLLTRIFEPFFTTKQVGQGTGLGLAMVHGIMRSHEGAIDVQSAPDTGSTFTLYFPALAVAADPAPPCAPPAPAPEGANRHVMYVDDDTALNFLVERALRRRGFRISSFTDPQLALAALREHEADFDLLVTDYNMPGYCGLDLMREATRLRPDLPVALASGYVTPEIEQQALAAGARALIYKPNDVDELCDTVQRLLQPGDAD